MENSFGMLFSMFRVFKNAMQLRPQRGREILMACVVLHNMLKPERGAGGREEGDLEDEWIPCHFPEWSGR